MNALYYEYTCIEVKTRFTEDEADVGGPKEPERALGGRLVDLDA